MSEAAKMRLIEITIRDGAKRKLFLVPSEKANAIEILIKEPAHSENSLIDAGEVFPNLRDPKKRPFIVFRGIRAKTGLTQQELAKRLGITQVEISKIEHAKRSIGKKLAKKIEEEFKIDYRRFL